MERKDESAVGFAIASVICMFVGLFILGIFMEILAVVFGALALRGDKVSKTVGCIGMVLGAIFTVICVIALAVA